LLFGIALLGLSTGCGNSDVPVNSSTCPASLTSCDGVCSNLQTDLHNCGACGTACPAGQVCSTGACAVSCQQGLTDCSGACASLTTDAANCGSCGNACPAGELCSAGACALSCQQGLTECSGLCVDKLTDRANCGGCGTVCADGQVCSNGTCALSCQQGLTECSGLCVNLLSDPASCGACGHGCSAGEVCSNGTCALSCQQGLTDCSGVCSNLQTDNQSCGACSAPCASGQICSAGTCALSCQQGLTECSGLCVDKLTDRSNCGECGNACGDGQVCSNGSCVLSCQQGLTDCSGLCIDTLTDRANCGECGTVCADGQVCSNGTCALSCQQGLTECSGLCVDKLTDRSNCGECGTACADGQVCSNGTCALSCQEGLTDCSSVCVDTLSDRRNCGACANACAAGQVCSNGLCALSCQQGLTECNGTCRDVQNDALNCGACGAACEPGQTCSAGTCVASCGGALLACSNVCVDPRHDPANCGSCGNACVSGPNADAVCVDSACETFCHGGHLDCDAQAATGCEIDGSADVSNCGVCGNACPTVPNGSRACAYGICGVGSCDPGFGDCDSDPADGCEIDELIDVDHCGGCANACPAVAHGTRGCSAGTCDVASCDANFGDCDHSVGNGCEIDERTNVDNCGACGHACPTVTNGVRGCAASTCVIATCNAGFGNCDGNTANGCEVNEQTDLANCGACGNVCPAVPNGTRGCAAGVCGVVSCNTNYGNCDLNPANGCESNFLTDANNCGRCGNACGSGHSCVSGTCVVSTLGQLIGTNTTNITRGVTYNSIFADPVTGKVYWMPSYSNGTQATEYPDVANFKAGTNGRTINLAVGYEGTYHAAINGFLYYNQYGTSTMVKIRASDGTLVTSRDLAGAGHTNQSAFQWGGYSDICFYADTGNVLYVIWAVPSGNMQVSRLSQSTLAVEQTWTIGRQKANTGYAFVVNGVVYIGNAYSSPAINGAFTLATGAYNTSYSNSLTPVSNDYIAALYWNPATNELFEETNGHTLIYPNAAR
jgi:hypothetical protein